MLLPHCVISSEAFRTASTREKCVLIVLCLKHNGFNNGRIILSSIDLAHSLDCQNHAANALAMRGLILRGFVELMKDHPRGCRLAREYRLTFIPTETRPASHEYLQWRAGDAGTHRKKRVAITAIVPSHSVATVANQKKASVAMAAAEKNGSRADPPISRSGSFATTATHISYHSNRSAPGRFGAGETGGGATASHCVSVAPSPDELRSRARQHVVLFGRGSQGRLARQAAIPQGTFSKFLASRGALPDEARVRLACVFPRAEAAERALRAPDQNS